MASVVNAVIRGLGKPYADGTESIEIHVPPNHAHGLPFSYGTRVPVVLIVNGETYHAGLRATLANKYVWICPNVKTKDGKSKKLAHIVADAGFKKNDRAILEVTETGIVLKTGVASTPNGGTHLLPEEVETGGDYVEGATFEVQVVRYERDLGARSKCISHHGTSCSVCGFEFARIYGAIGSGFIHVHHLIPLSQINSQYTVDPIRDLRPVCPNCHAMLHMRSPPYSIEELRMIMKSNGKP